MYSYLYFIHHEVLDCLGKRVFLFAFAKKSLNCVGKGVFVFVFEVLHRLSKRMRLLLLMLMFSSKPDKVLTPPQHAEHMGDILISETMADFDQDGDGKLDLAE